MFTALLASLLILVTVGVAFLLVIPVWQAVAGIVSQHVNNTQATATLSHINQCFLWLPIVMFLVVIGWLFIRAQREERGSRVYPAYPYYAVKR